MVTALTERVAARGDELAIADEFGSWTWAEHEIRLNRLIHGLRALGLGVGDRVALLGGNRHEWVELWCAIGGIGGVSVPINWHFTVDEIAYVIEDSGATALVADASFAEQATAVAEQTGVPLRLAFGGTIDGFVDYEALVAAADSEPPVQVAGATMFYTSGTTGRPKGVVSSLVEVGGDPHEVIERVGMLLSLWQVPTDGVVLCNAPLYHAGPIGQCLLPFLLGASLILRRKWDADETLRLIDEHQVTNHYAVPTHFSRLLRLPEERRAAFSGASLRYVIHSAAPCPPDVKRRMLDWWGPVINEAYGASEGGATSTFVTGEEWLARPGTVGRPTAVCEVLILDDDHRPVGPNEVGQVYLRNLLGLDFEYHGDAEKTDAAHLAPGVFTFGDIGHVDDEGYLFLSDRKIDMIISGGVNIYPAEIEAVLVTHPAVVDAGVFGIPNDEFGEEVKAAVELIDGSDECAVEADLRRLCRQGLAGYKVPRSFDFGPLPRTATGKLPKRALRSRYWEAEGRVI